MSFRISDEDRLDELKKELNSLSIELNKKYPTPTSQQRNQFNQAIAETRAILRKQIIEELKVELNPNQTIKSIPPTSEQLSRFGHLMEKIKSDYQKVGFISSSKLPKTPQECKARLQQAQDTSVKIREQQIKLSSELVELVILDSKILTPENLKALTGLVALGGKEMLPLLTAAVKEEPSKEVVERAGKIGLYSWLYEQLLNFFNEKLNKQGK